MGIHRRLCSLFVCLAILGAVDRASTQSASSPAPAAPTRFLPARTGHAMVTAGPDGGVIAIGGSVAAGDSAWRLSGNSWQPIAPGGPANRMMIAAAFDTRRNVLVAFGGVGARNGSRYGETWEWNGRVWDERDVRGPGARDHHAMAYDEARGQVVMYGGMNGDHNGLQSDTWTWDGAVWTRAEEKSGPGGIGHHAMAYDSKRQRVVLYGGITDNGPATDDVWEWDGKTWHRISAAGPGPRSHIKMAYDAARGVVVMFGGGVPGAGPSGSPPVDTWTWDGRAWTRAATTGPIARYLHAMAYDAGSQRIVMTAGNRSARPYDALADTWEWDGASWKEVTPAAVSDPVTPPARAHHSVVYDAANKRVILAGGSTTQDGGKTYITFDDLWSFDGHAWKSLGSSGARRSGMALAFDSKRNRVLAFGGYCACQPENGGRYSDLLELRNGQWQSISQNPARPSADSKMVYDSRRDRLVLYGGSTPASRNPADVWEFDGNSWKQFGGVVPEALADVAMAYDEQRGRTVVFGKPQANAAATTGETWEFDGATWARVSLTGPLPPRTASMVYDQKRHIVILHGAGTDTWSWNGNVWTKLNDAGPPARYFGALAYDAARDRLVLFGGRPGLPKPDANDVWEWDGTSWKSRS